MRKSRSESGHDRDHGQHRGRDPAECCHYTLQRSLHHGELLNDCAPVHSSHDGPDCPQRYAEFRKVPQQPLDRRDHGVGDKLDSGSESALEFLVDFQAQFLPRAVHLREVAAEVVVHYGGHFLSCAACCSQVVLIPGYAVHAFVEDQVQPLGGVCGERRGQGHGPLGVAHSICGGLHFGENVRQVAEVALRVHDGHGRVADLDLAVVHGVCYVSHDSSQSGACFAALVALVCHAFQQRGDGFHVLPGCVQVGGAVLVGFAQCFGGGVAARLSRGQQVGEVCRLIGLHSEGAQVVCYHVGGSAQLHAGRRRQI